LALGPDGMEAMDILRGARELGLKAKEAQVSFDRLKHLPMPAIVLMEERKFNARKTRLFYFGNSLTYVPKLTNRSNQYNQREF
jgi:ABC-type bacteriocin/lantibiotic exporter with double-glycine peptidase domain